MKHIKKALRDIIDNPDFTAEEEFLVGMFVESVLMVVALIGIMSLI